MLEMIRDLVDHKGYANAALLGAIRENGAAASDPELWDLLHHVLLANRFWLLTVVGWPFVLDEESRSSPAFDVLVQRFAHTQMQEAAWLDGATSADLERKLRNPFIPDGQCSIAQALVQVCLHSHGHRAQAAKLLRRKGGTPPGSEFIEWLTNRQAAKWPHPLDAEAT